MRKKQQQKQEVLEDKNETEELTTKVCEILKQKGIDIDKTEILAIDRISTKKGKIRPVLIKTINNDVNSRVMRYRKAMREAGFRAVYDVTKMNTGPINRLNLHTEIQST